MATLRTSEDIDLVGGEACLPTIRQCEASEPRRARLGWVDQYSSFPCRFILARLNPRLGTGVEAAGSRSQNVFTAQVWPDLPPPTELLTPALVGAGTLVVQVRAPAIRLPDIVVPLRLALEVTAPAM